MGGRFLLLLLFLMVVCLPASATNYHFSSDSGDDSRSSVEARNPETPWKSLDKLNIISRSLMPGDSVLFRRGEVFYGAITLSSSGLPNRPIVFAAYGQGAMPVITSLVDLEYWAEVQNGIFEATHPSLGKSLNLVLLNGSAEEMGRYPNSNASNGGYMVFDETNGEDTIFDGGLMSVPDWSGAEVVIRKSRWTIDRHKIKSHSGNSISFLSLERTYKPVKNYGYFIQDHVHTLDEKGEWYFDETNKKVLLYFGNSDPASSVVQVSTKENLVSNDRPVGFIVFTGLHFKGANSYAISIANSNNIVLDKCQIDFSGIDGVSARDTPFFEVQNSKISYSMNNGIHFGENTPNAIVRNNLVECTNLFAGMGQSGNGNGVAIQTSSGHNVIELNKVINTGYIGIRFSGDSTIVKNNFIDSFCLTKDDGAGIYTWTGSPKEKHFGRKIIGNIVVNGKGVNEGTPSAKVANPPAEGIYIDDYASGIEVLDNTVANVNGRGVFVHNARDLIIKNNSLYNNGHQIYILQDALDFPTRNNIIKQNLLVSPNFGQTNVTIRTNQQDVSLLASFEENRHLNFYDDAKIHVNKVTEDKLHVSEFFDLTGWKNLYPNSDLSYNKKRQTRFHVQSVLSRNLVSNGDFNSNVDGSHCFSSTEDCLATWSDNKFLDQGSVKVTTKGMSFLLMGFGGIFQDKKYVLRFSALAEAPMGVKIFLRQSEAPYHPISEAQVVLLEGQRKEYEVLFSSPLSEAKSSLVFEVGTAEQTSYWLDNIFLHEAEVLKDDFNDQLLFFHNPSAIASELFLKDTYEDFNNRRYQGTLSLNPYSSLLLWPVQEQ